MKLTHPLLYSAAIVLAATSVCPAATVDLSSWIGTSGGTWNVQSGNDSVLQTTNGNPTFFYEPGSNAQGMALSGKITVTTTSDNDFIGFALGLDASDINSAASNFILVDWKQADQGAAQGGLAISHVSKSDIVNDFWSHAGGVTEITRAATLGSTGWADNTEYSFDLQFTSSAIQVFVDGNLELDITAGDAGLSSFDDGAFAFYNYSQSSVLYSAIEEDITALPTPGASVPDGGTTGILLGMGLLGLAAKHRQQLRADRHC